MALKRTGPRFKIVYHPMVNKCLPNTGLLKLAMNKEKM